MSPNVMKHRPYRGSPILKCVVSIWALLLREWGVEACQDGFGHFLFIHVARGCKGLPGWFGALFFHICPFYREGGRSKAFLDESRGSDWSWTPLPWNDKFSRSTPFSLDCNKRLYFWIWFIFPMSSTFGSTESFSCTRIFRWPITCERLNHY